MEDAESKEGDGVDRPELPPLPEAASAHPKRTHCGFLFSGRSFLRQRWPLRASICKCIIADVANDVQMMS